MTARTRLGVALRDVVVEHVARRNVTEEYLAETLNVSSEAVRSMLEKPYWDVDLSLRLVDQLEVPFHVVLD